MPFGRADKGSGKMKRYALCLALVSLGFGSLALPAPAMAGSAEIKKACNDQYEMEKKAKSLPRGMTHEKYMHQCTMNWAANHPATQAATSQTPAATDQSAGSTWPPAPGQ
jgi:hypothetical protein